MVVCVLLLHSHGAVAAVGGWVAAAVVGPSTPFGGFWVCLFDF